jgi:mycothiol synthase
LTLTIRNYKGQDDIPALTALFNAAAKIDGPEFGTTEEEERQFMSGPTVKPEENVFFFEADGQLVGYGRCELEESSEESVFFLRGIVHPDWRRQGIGTQVMEHLEQHVQEQLDEATNQTIYCSARTRLESEGRQALFRKMGYKLVRYFFDMECPLQEEGVPLKLAKPTYPPGITVQTMAERPALRAVWQATDEAFLDHWGHMDTSFEQWQHWTSYPHHQPELWFAAWDTEKDEVAGVCLNGIDPEHNTRMQREEGWVYVLAVRQPCRRQGLGTALLLEGLGALQRAGVEYGMLGVDTENLTGALRLYERVGFRPTKKSAAFRKVLRS